MNGVVDSVDYPCTFASFLYELNENTHFEICLLFYRRLWWLVQIRI